MPLLCILFALHTFLGVSTTIHVSGAATWRSVDDSLVKYATWKSRGHVAVTARMRCADPAGLAPGAHRERGTGEGGAWGCLKRRQRRAPLLSEQEEWGNHFGEEAGGYTGQV